MLRKAAGNLFTNNSFMPKHREVEIYCDGACFANGTPKAVASWAFYEPESGMKMAGLVPKSKETDTNNRGELFAMYAALQWSLDKGMKCVHIITDSQYAKNVTLGGFRRMKNIDLLNAIDTLVDQMCCLNVSWVKGHGDNRGNIVADQLAAEVLEQKLGSNYSRANSYDKGRDSTVGFSHRLTNVSVRGGRGSSKTRMGK